MIPDIIEGIASFIITLNIICVFVAPKDFAASINPSSTSFKAFSIILAINGAAPIVIGTIAAVSPILVPIKNLVNGINATNNISYGKLEKFREDVLGSLIITVKDHYANAVKGYLDEKNIKWEEIKNDK